MLMCGGLCGVAARTDARSRSIALRDACTDAKKLGLGPDGVHVESVIWYCLTAV